MPSTLSTTSSQEVWSSSESVPHFRSLQEHYEVTTNQDNLTLFSLFVCCEPMNFQKVVENLMCKVYRVSWSNKIYNIVPLGLHSTNGRGRSTESPKFFLENMLKVQK